MSKNVVFVESEFAPLKRVVLAQSQYRASDLGVVDAQSAERELAILPLDQQAYLRKLAGHDLADVDPERQQDWERERENLRVALESLGVEVLRPRLLTGWEKEAAGAAGYMNAYVRDPWFTIGKFVIEGSLRFPHRSREVLPSRRVLHSEVMAADCTYVALPAPEVVPLETDDGSAGPFLEGGDVLVLGRHVFVGCSGRASNEAGVGWLAKLLEPERFTVELVPLQPHFLHLDCVLGLLRDGLMVVYEGGLINGVPSRLADWDRITVSESEAMMLGTNGLPLSSDRYVADPAFERIGDEVERHGISVIYVDFAISRGFGGSFRCSTQPLWRE
jgi:N-dimethylarginine dimethylaminohydrolase